MTVRSGRRLINWVIMTCVFILSVACGWGEGEQPRLTAPGGSEIDLVQNITKCFGTSSKLVEASWKTYSIEAKYLEYNRNDETVRARNNVKVKQDSPVNRVVTCSSLFFDLKNNLINAQKEVKIQYDQDTSLLGDSLEWDRKNDSVKVNGSAQINYQDWKITGEKIEGQLNKGIFIFYGPVKGEGQDCSLRAGQIVFDRSVDMIFLKNNPVIVQGKNEFTAPEIVYDLKTRKVTSKPSTKVN